MIQLFLLVTLIAIKLCKCEPWRLSDIPDQHIIKSAYKILFIVWFKQFKDIDPLCNLYIHPPGPTHSASTHLHQVAVMNHTQAIMPSMWTVMSYDNTVNNNFLTTYGSFVITTLTHGQRYKSHNEAITWLKHQAGKSHVVSASCTCQYQIKQFKVLQKAWNMVHLTETESIHHVVIQNCD